MPCFSYRRYTNTFLGLYDTGTCILPSDGSGSVVNWPDQQLRNGKKKNNDTGHRYKNFVRALKNAENTLADAGVIEELPSYLMECLVYNVPNAVLRRGSDLSSGFEETLTCLAEMLAAPLMMVTMIEPNEIKSLFGGNSWTPEQAKQLIAETRRLLDYP